MMQEYALWFTPNNGPLQGQTKDFSKYDRVPLQLLPTDTVRFGLNGLVKNFGSFLYYWAGEYREGHICDKLHWKHLDNPTQELDIRAHCLRASL